MHVGIIGAGFGGCAAALALRRDGHAVTLLEAVAAPQPVGAGIMLQPSGMTALAALGLLPAVLSHGEKCARLRCATPAGRVLFDLPYAVGGAGLFGLGLHRGALFDALYGALSPAGVNVRLGVAAAHVERGVVRDTRGGRHGPFDLVVAADGARSAIRRALGHARRDEEYPWGALWFVARDPARRFTGELFQAVDGAGAMLGILPTGTTARDATPRASVFFSVRLSAVPALRARGLAAWKDAARALAPAVEPVLDQVRSFDDLLVASYRDVVLDRLDFGRLVYVGDAAHAMSPQLGQGSNLALLDALALAEAIRTHATLGDALRAYSRARARQLGFYQWMTRRLTPFFQGDHGVLGDLRDVVMPLAARVPWVRAEMVHTMCGVKLGPLGARMPVAREVLATDAAPEGR